MSWLPGRNTTIATPIPLSGPGPIRRCVSGSPNMPREFSAGFRAGDTRAEPRARYDARKARTFSRNQARRRGVVVGRAKMTGSMMTSGRTASPDRAAASSAG